MNLQSLLEEWRRTESFMAHVTHWVVEPASAARLRSIPGWIHPDVRKGLHARGIDALYQHQTEALEYTRRGRNVIVVTPTASGKTLCYNLPVLHEICRDPASRALYLFPTKALGQDQVAELALIVQHLETTVHTYTYDGDTPAPMRRHIREAGHVVVTNPDMLHAAILPHHTKWLRLFENLRYVVLDEAHVYRGVFGSHVANVIRRLLRVCRHYGSRPQFILCSATIANPAELARELTGSEVEVIDKSGAPRGERHFVFYNPPLVRKDLGVRRSALSEARRIGGRLIREGISTIAFLPTRTQVELLSAYWKQDAPERLRQRVAGYRGGYLPGERRALERGLRNGDILAVASTNALELGIDIGSLEVSLSVGYPGSVASLRQQSGRAGRRHGLSAAVFIAGPSALDQYVVHHADRVLATSPEAARIYPENLLILMDHLKCAAYELPFAADEQFGVETTAELLAYLAEQRVVHQGHDGRFHWMADSLPSHGVSLRSAARDNVVIINVEGVPSPARGLSAADVLASAEPGALDEAERRAFFAGSRLPRPQVIGEMDRFSALTMLHPQAIYMHQSRLYQVEELDWENGKAFVRPVAADYYTDAELAVTLRVLDVFGERAQAPEGPVHRFGEVMVTATPTVYKKIKLDTHENVGWGKIHLPEMELHTMGYWCAWPRDALPFARSEWESALRGAAWALRHAAALHCMCATGDIQVAVEIRDVLSGLPTLYLYDTYPGGVGLADRVYRQAEQVFAAAVQMIRDCGCEAGCPACVGPALPGAAGGGPPLAAPPLAEGASAEVAAGGLADAGRQTPAATAKELALRLLEARGVLPCPVP